MRGAGYHSRDDGWGRGAAPPRTLCPTDVGGTATVGSGGGCGALAVTLVTTGGAAGLRGGERGTGRAGRDKGIGSAADGLEDLDFVVFAAVVSEGVSIADGAIVEEDVDVGADDAGVGEEIAAEQGVFVENVFESVVHGGRVDLMS